MIRLCGSVKFFWALASGELEGGAACRPPLRRPSASRLLAASSSALSLASAAAFASTSSSALAWRRPGVVRQMVGHRGQDRWGRVPDHERERHHGGTDRGRSKEEGRLTLLTL